LQAPRRDDAVCRSHRRRALTSIAQRSDGCAWAGGVVSEYSTFVALGCIRTTVLYDAGHQLPEGPMHEINVSLIAANILGRPDTTATPAPTADPSHVAEFNRLMNAAPSEGAADRYIPVTESPLETLSSAVAHLGSHISGSMRTEMTQFDAKLDAIDPGSPTTLLEVTQLQMHAFGAMYQVQMATGLAGQADRGFETLLHVQN
jgi:hypothetical protein